MNNLQIFENQEFGSIRTVTINGEPWFVGKDIAEALGYGDGNKKSKALTNAISDHVDGEDKKLMPYEFFKGCQNGDLKNISHYGATIINESGMYSLIFGSKLESAKRFKRWVTSEVLPAIRKTGKYEMVPTNPLPKAQSVSEAVNLGKFVRDLLKDQGASPYQMADILLDTMKQFGVSLSDKLLLPVKLDKVREDELDMVEFKFAFPESTWQDYMTYRTLLKVSR